MLFGSVAKSRPSTRNARVVSLPDDDPVGLQVIFNIIHCHFKAVPAILSLDELLSVSVHTDKYDITHVTRPWLGQWLSILDFEFDRNETFETLVSIAWEFGDAGALRSASHDHGTQM